MYLFAGASFLNPAAGVHKRVGCWIPAVLYSGTLPSVAGVHKGYPLSWIMAPYPLGVECSGQNNLFRVHEGEGARVQDKFYTPAPHRVLQLGGEGRVPESTRGKPSFKIVRMV